MRQTNGTSQNQILCRLHQSHVKESLFYSHGIYVLYIVMKPPIS